MGIRGPWTCVPTLGTPKLTDADGEGTNKMNSRSLEVIASYTLSHWNENKLVIVKSSLNKPMQRQQATCTRPN